MIYKACSSIEELPYSFHGHLSNFKVTRDKNMADFLPNWAFLDCNSTLNSPMALKCCTKLDRRGALLFFEVIHQISRSHRPKNWQIKSSLSKITRPATAIKFLKFACFSLGQSIVCIDTPPICINTPHNTIFWCIVTALLNFDLVHDEFLKAVYTTWLVLPYR